MSIHNICFPQEIRKNINLFINKKIFYLEFLSILKIITPLQMKFERECSQCHHIV